MQKEWQCLLYSEWNNSHLRACICQCEPEVRKGREHAGAFLVRLGTAGAHRLRGHKGGCLMDEQLNILKIKGQISKN